MNIFSFFRQKQNTNKECDFKKSVTDSTINRAYEKRGVEIKSLREYDQGKKHIDAPDLNSIVRSL